jgi:hypothetical protein
MYSYLQSWIWEEEEIAQADPRQKHLKYVCMKQINESRLMLKSVTFDDLPPLIVMRREKTITKANKIYKRKLKKNIMKAKYISDLE